MRIPFIFSLRVFFTACLIIVSQHSWAEDVCFQCHERADFNGGAIHQPVAESRCSLCHNPHVAKHSKLLREREDELCFSCHRNSEEEFHRDIVHAPIKNGKCSVCHTPHGGSEKKLVHSDLAQQCFTCHKDLENEARYSHEPFRKGDCQICHKPHQADNVQLLAGDPDELCFSCHESEKMQQNHKGYPLKVKNCLSCHNPHGSNRHSLVRNFLHKPYEEGCGSCHQENAKVTMAKCLECHEGTGKDILASHSHISLQDGNSCLGCHSPHTGDEKPLLLAKEVQVCRSCHSETLDNYGHARSRHPPVEKCSTCHDSHGSNNLAMMKTDGNDICIQCHETQGNFTHPVGSEVLNTHNGQMITCVSCHNPMGTDHKFHLVLEGKRALCVLCHRSY